MLLTLESKQHESGFSNSGKWIGREQKSLNKIIKRINCSPFTYSAILFCVSEHWILHVLQGEKCPCNPDFTVLRKAAWFYVGSCTEKEYWQQSVPRQGDAAPHCSTCLWLLPVPQHCMKHPCISCSVSEGHQVHHWESLLSVQVCWETQGRFGFTGEELPSQVHPTFSYNLT